MDNVKLELSARYYVAETATWFLGATLIVLRFVGLDTSQPIPVLQVVLEDKQNYSRVVAALLIAFALYLLFEWKQSSRKSRESYWSQARAGLTTLFSCVSLWLCYPLITANTGFAVVSPGWFLGFLAIGYFLGLFASILGFSSLMIRTPTEARDLQFPRVPVATRAQYIMLIPIVFLLLVAFYILRHYSPEIIKEFGLGFVLVCVPFLFIIGEEYAWLFLSQDESGNRIPLAKRIAKLKEAHDFHDYSYHLIDLGRKVTEETNIDPTASQQEIQKTIQKEFSVESRTSSFCGKLQEEIQLSLYYKDGNKENQSPENRGLKIEKQKGKKGLLRVQISFEDPEMEPQEIEIPIGLIESNAEEYLSTHPDEAEIEPEKFLSYVLNQAITQTVAKNHDPLLLLHMAVSRGLEDQVVELLKQEVNVNKPAAAGWTALLHASANNYPRICRLLLDAGANPDIGNINRITPLMYGARYGNFEICKLLLEFGANTDLQDVYGDTALIIASRGGYVDIVDMLLEAGADSVIKNSEDLKALDIAHKNRQGEIAKRLRLS